MYLPLRFLEQVDNYIYPADYPKLKDMVNKVSIEVVTKIVIMHKDFIFETYAKYKDFIHNDVKKIDLSIVKRWELISETYKAGTNLMCRPDEDLLNTILFTHIRNEWRMRKIVYRVSKNLQETLVSMKMNKLVSLDCITNLPSNYFYVDYSEGEGFCGNDKGCMISCNKSEECISIICVLLLDNEKVNTVIMSIGVDISGEYEHNSLLLSVDDAHDKINLELECGNAVLYEKKFKTFLLNFFTYMYAINKDVEVTERAAKLSKRDKSQCIKEPTNRFKEIEDYNIGFRYIKSPNNKVKYIYDDEYQSQHTGSSKCTHYRQAHWHSYWTGKGNDKKLIVRWVEGTMVNGIEAKNITVKEV